MPEDEKDDITGLLIDFTVYSVYVYKQRVR